MLMCGDFWEEGEVVVKDMTLGRVERRLTFD
jgi:hypothetical protein